MLHRADAANCVDHGEHERAPDRIGHDVLDRFARYEPEPVGEKVCSGAGAPE